MNAEFIQVTTTLSDQAAATRLAELMVETKLAACVQVLGPIQSTYRWQGTIETATEFLCIAKTSSAQFEKIAAVISESHPYDVPEIIATPITYISPKYMQWLQQATS